MVYRIPPDSEINAKVPWNSEKGGFFFRIDSPRQITAILEITWILYDYDTFAPSIQHVFNQQFFFIFVIFWPTEICTIMSQFFVIII